MVAGCGDTDHECADCQCGQERHESCTEGEARAGGYCGVGRAAAMANRRLTVTMTRHCLRAVSARQRRSRSFRSSLARLRRGPSADQR